jgi:Rap1a immunity proteins
MRIFLVLVSFFFIGAAKADELTAGDLYSFCTSSDQMASTACRFYILGVVNGVRLGDGMYLGANKIAVERKRTIFCNPDNMLQSEMVDLIKNFFSRNFKNHPEDKDLPADTTISAAMGTKFPCPR